MDERLPPKGYFASFVEEKEYRRMHPPVNGEAWGTVQLRLASGCIGVDPDIWEVVQGVNRIDFLYASGQSCSGSFKDHKEYLCRLKEPFQDRREQGFVIVRADTSDSRFAVLERGLELICNVAVNEIPSMPDGRPYSGDDSYQRQEGVKNIALQAFVPKEVLDGRHPLHATYLTEVWQNVARFLRRFYTESTDERIKRRLKGR
jgi:hypothetical protein